MAIDVTNLFWILSQRVSQGLTPLEIQMYTKAIELLNIGTLGTVPNTAALPSTSESVEGQLIFVENENTLYVYNQKYGVWKTVTQSTGPKIWSFGSNDAGQLGINDGVCFFFSSPVPVAGFNDWCQVSSGFSHSIGLRSNGTLWAWGSNYCGRLGDGTLASQSIPVSVIGGFTDWCQVSAGVYHTSAIRTNGTLWTWGMGASGLLGDNSLNAKSSPVSVVGGFTDWCQVNSGCRHAAAVRTNGTLWTWGLGTYGRLGDNSTITKSSPVSVVGGFTDWCRVSVGGVHTAALRTNGTLWTWGGNPFGQLGSGTINNQSSPGSVIGGFTDWCQVSAGFCHTVAIRTNGTLWAWGRNHYGQLGINSITAVSSPVSNVSGFTDWCQVSASCQHTAAVRTNGTLWSWGLNNKGQLGDGTFINKSSPVSVIGGFTDWCQVSSGGSHTGVVRTNLI